MDLVMGIRGRRSIRSFQDRPVDHDLIRDIVDTAAYAPSWKNSQTVRYLVVEDQEKIQAIADAGTLGFSYNANTLSGAPALVLLTTVKGRCGYERDGSFSTPKGDRWEMFDAGIAAQTFCLAAHEKGLGTVIMGIFDEEAIGKIVPIPEGQQISALIPIGYPAKVPATPPRKTSRELLTFL